MLRTWTKASSWLAALFVASAVQVGAQAEDPALDRPRADSSSTVVDETPAPPGTSDQASMELSPQAAAEIERLKVLYPDTMGNVKYERSGHQYTTYIVAMAAGLDRKRAHELAFYSQFPDDERQFSATLAAFKIFDLEYRRKIMAVLHSLHGGDNAAVLKRRRDLKNLVTDGISNGTLDDYQIGLIIHAFADSYAHTTGSDAADDLRAFDYGVGHLFHGHKPDIIAYNPPKYRAYSCALFEALASSGTCETRLSELNSLIEGLKTSRDAELPRFESLAKDRYEFDADEYKTIEVRRDPPVGSDEVVATLTAMERAFSQ